MSGIMSDSLLLVVVVVVVVVVVMPFSANVLCGSNTDPVCTWTNAGSNVLYECRCGG